jgi:8-oxo-dGTP diphosphatase
VLDAPSYSLKPFFVSAVSVDIVIFGFENKSLRVLLVQRGVEPYMNRWALPGEMVKANENLDAAADRVLFELTSMNEVYLEQVASFGAPERHPAGRAFTVAYYSLIGTSAHPVSPNGWAKHAQYFDINELPDLAFDHADVLNACLERLRERVRMRPIGFELLPRTFSLSDLQNLYESILGETLDKRNFRKKILSMGIVEDTGDLQSNVNHRPAKLYRFDESRYEALVKKGFSFTV